MNSKKCKIIGFLILHMIFALLIGCANDKNIKIEPIHEEEIVNLDVFLQEQGIVAYEVRDVVEKDGTIYILLEVWDDKSNGQLICEVKDWEISEIANWEIEDGTYTKSMDIDTLGNLYILEEQQKNNTMHTVIKYVSQESCFFEEHAIDKWVDENDSVKFIQSDGMQNIYLFFESGKIKLLSADFQWSMNISGYENGYLVDATRMPDGNVIFLFVQYIGNKEKLRLYKLEKEVSTSKELLTLPEGTYGTNILFSGTGIYDFYIKGENGILGGRLDESDLTAIIRFQDADIVSSEVKFVCACGEDKVFAVKESETTDLIFVAKGRKKSEEEKEVLYLALLDENYAMEKEVAEFNKNNRNYRIELKKYSDCEEPIQKFLVDYATGTEFDMVEFSSEEMDRLVSKEIFVDLYPFIDEDVNIDRNDFYGNVLKAYEFEGKLYQTVSFVHLYGWVTRKSNLNEFGQWNFESFQNYVEQNLEGNIFTNSSEEQLLKQLVTVSSNELLDWNQKVCHFESDAFKDILDFSKKYGLDQESIQLDDMVPALIDNRLLFVETSFGIEELYMYSESLGEDVAVVASPLVGNMGVNLYSTMPQLGIIAKSSNVDGSWQFVRRFFTRQYQDISDDDKYLQSGATGFPVRKDCMENLLKRFTATEDYEKDGKWYKALQSNDYLISWDGYDIDVGPLGQSEEKLLNELLLNTSCRQGVDYTIQDIILEESKSFFCGEKDAEETAKIIQSRVSIYMNE